MNRGPIGGKAAKDHRETVLAAFQKALESDPVKIVVHGMTSLGLLEVTRRKTSESLSSQRLRPCPCCGGSGQVIEGGEVRCHSGYVTGG